MKEYGKFTVEGLDVIVEKLAAEFNVWELKYSPYGKFKIKVFQKSQDNYVAYSNLMVKNRAGDFDASIGYGDTVESALHDVIKCYKEQVSDKPADEWGKKI